MEIDLEREARHNTNWQRRLLLTTNSILVAAVMWVQEISTVHWFFSVMSNGGMRCCMFAVGVVGPCRGRNPCGCAARGGRPVSA